MIGAERFWSKVKLANPEDCWEWTAGLFKCGYGMFRARKQARYAHRIAWELWNGPPGDLCVLHHCDNRLCVNPHHLFLGTRGDNARDCWAKGRGPRMVGEMAGAAKLTEPEVRAIRRRYGSGKVIARELADEYGVAIPTIYGIVHRRKWKHVA